MDFRLLIIRILGYVCEVMLIIAKWQGYISQ